MKFKKRIRRALNYWRWRLGHPTAPYEQYYVHRVMAKIRSGHGHPAIGPTARPLRNESELLDFLLKHGLQPGDLTVDYGCGSLRLAPPLINFLEPDKYWGMDLAQDFLDLGRAHLSPDLAEAKRPRLDVIADDVIHRARAERPRYIISWHVCSKVPEGRFDAYVGNIATMMTPGATALVHFPEAAELRKLTGLAWARPRAQITSAVARANPKIACDFSSVVEGEIDGIRHSYAILTLAA
ncbi:MAG TPA: class I SAM-dependent methyltransferase [Dongiaceae bacterium]|nr:class I SAM-dependent methyltransferase [Dongiaceae bacterium]